jgi:hypothetical protein
MLASAVALGLAAGLAVRRSWRPLLNAQIRWLPVLIGSFVVRALASFVGDAGFVLYVAALAGTSAAAAANHRLTGAMLVAFGGCLNLIVVLLNHGMPVDAGALISAGAQMPHDALHVVLDGRTSLAVLADVIPMAAFRSVYSIGDLFIAIGGFLVPLTLFVRR